MTTFTNNDVASGAVVRASDHNTQGSRVAAVLNGGIDNANINPSAAIDGSKLADFSVTNAKLATGAGEPGGAWNSWTPTWTNFTVGNGTVSASYKQIGDTVDIKMIVTLGSTSAVSGDVDFSLPVTAVSPSSITSIGNTLSRDVSVGNFIDGRVGTFSATNVKFYTVEVSGSVLRLKALSATSPFTWATGDIMTLSARYEAA
jgi:hypothetical protein